MQTQARLATCVVILFIVACYAQAYKITPLTPLRNGKAFPLALGEGPHWDADKQELFFVDILDKMVYRYIPEADQFFSVNVDGWVTPVIPVQGTTNKFLLGVHVDFKIMEWDGLTTQPTNLTSIHVLDEALSHRFNDGKCDPRGRLWAGTMDESGEPNPSGALYKLSSDGSVSRWVSEVAISNGLAWSPDNSTFYYIDTPTLRVDAFDYEVNGGSISNRRTVFDFPANGITSGAPDGMTIDADGNIWVAMWGGSSVHNINPRTGSLIRTLDFTGLASRITSLAFGGPNLDTLYVTSAFNSGSGESASGSLFRVDNLGGPRGVSGGVPFVQQFN